MNVYECNKKLKIARQRGFIINQIKIYSSLSIINTCYYLKFRMQIMHRHFFGKISQSQENIKTVCNDLKNPFHFACQGWINKQ